MRHLNPRIFVARGAEFAPTYTRAWFRMAFRALVDFRPAPVVGVMVIGLGLLVAGGASAHRLEFLHAAAYAPAGAVIVWAWWRAFKRNVNQRLDELTPREDREHVAYRIAALRTITFHATPFGYDMETVDRLLDVLAEALRREGEEVERPAPKRPRRRLWGYSCAEVDDFFRSIYPDES